MSELITLSEMPQVTGLDQPFKPTHIVCVVTNGVRDRIEDVAVTLGIHSDNIYIITRAHESLEIMLTNVRRSISAARSDEPHADNSVAAIVEAPPISGLAQPWQEVMRQIRANFHGRMSRSLLVGPSVYKYQLPEKFRGMVPIRFNITELPEMSSQEKERLLSDEIEYYNRRYHDEQIHADQEPVARFDYTQENLPSIINSILSQSGSNYHRSTMLENVRPNCE